MVSPFIWRRFLRSCFCTRLKCRVNSRALRRLAFSDSCVKYARAACRSGAAMLSKYRIFRRLNGSLPDAPLPIPAIMAVPLGLFMEPSVFAGVKSGSRRLRYFEGRLSSAGDSGASKASMVLNSSSSPLLASSSLSTSKVLVLSK